MPVKHTAHGTTRGEAPKKKAAAPRKRLKKVRVEPTDNGGYVVSHHYHPEHGGTPKPERHAFADYDAAHKHLEQVTGGKQA